MKRSGADQGIRRMVYALTGTAVILIAVGVPTRQMWLLGLGAWVLIGAFLVEMIYRP
ncbi:hypothetical protein [Streptomyces sp. CB03238]|uniref:hypothetical protein n=1 Tax=Streptomyces sp. CB03238 TaxID=1907777 RepID=UPI0015C4269F|nr:hypothetical protein [Streptomyces sp. CB03238]